MGLGEVGFYREVFFGRDFEESKQDREGLGL